MKKYVRNKVKPEGLIAEGYAIDKTLIFMLLFKIDVENWFSKLENNIDGEWPRCKMDIFSQNVNIIWHKKYIKFDWTTRNKSHWYILNKYRVVELYIE